MLSILVTRQNPNRCVFFHSLMPESPSDISKVYFQISLAWREFLDAAGTSFLLFWKFISHTDSQRRSGPNCQSSYYVFGTLHHTSWGWRDRITRPGVGGPAQPPIQILVIVFMQGPVVLNVKMIICCCRLRQLLLLVYLHCLSRHRPDLWRLLCILISTTNTTSKTCELGWL